MIQLLVEGASDYTIAEAQERGLLYVPITITIDEVSYRSGIDIDSEQFFTLLAQTKDFPKTAQPSPQDFLDHFEAAKKNGDELICLTLSSALSGTYQSAMLARTMADYDGIYVIDTCSATFAIRILTEHARKRISEGMSAADLVQELEQLKSRVKVLAGVDTLEYLCRGGRLSRAAATIGELANLKPLITVTPEGTLTVPGKCIGRNKAIVSLLKMMEEQNPDPAFPIITLYASDASNCEKLEQKMQQTGYESSERLCIGPAIGTHAGPGAFGVVFVAR